MRPAINADSDLYPELLSDMAAVVAEALKAKGVTVEDAAKIGYEAAEHIREHYSGHLLYLPKGVRFDLSKRDLQIFGEFNGTNISDLADKYSLTEVRIYQIIKRVLVAERQRRQPDLFPDRVPGSAS